LLALPCFPRLFLDCCRERLNLRQQVARLELVERELLEQVELLELLEQELPEQELRQEHCPHLP